MGGIAMNIQPTRFAQDYARSIKLQREWIAAQKNRTLSTAALPTFPKEQDNTGKHTESIRGMLKAGKKLTFEEMHYLQKHAPDLYEKAVKADQERQLYEGALRQSRTKTEAQALYNHKLTMLAGEFKSRDPEETGMRMNAIQDADRNFALTNEYKCRDS